MALSARLQLRQSQSLVITPQLLQAIRLLQMSGLELERFVAAEIEQNPLLEEDDGVASAARAAAEILAGVPDRIAEAESEGPAEAQDASAPYDAAQSSMTGFRAGGGTQWDDLDIGQNLAARESLEAMLERRIDAVFTLPVERAIALSLLAGLDQAGYLTVSLEILAERLGAAPAEVEDVLQRCQEFAPGGVFARSLGECLSLQLAERNHLDPPMRTLLQNLDRLAAGERASLCLTCGVDRRKLDCLIAEIRSLDPKPGLAFDHEEVRALIPDVFVRRAADGGWSVELNDAALPRLLVNRIYHARISAQISADAERRYLAECLQKATWLEKSLDQRARTVLRVASEIVRRQESFLLDGVAHLKPLNLRMVADTLGIHESTVSRAAANKTIATPRGIFEFRYFFTGAIAASAGGEAHSAEAVKHRIRKLIDRESPEAVLSDDALVSILSREGVEIARRTVAKYRELMQIGSSVERRRERRMRVAS